MLLWFFVFCLVRILPLCNAVPFLSTDDGGGGDDKGDDSSGSRAEIAGMQIVSMSEITARYFFVINEYKGDEITRQSCCMTDLESPQNLNGREIPCLETSQYTMIEDDVTSPRSLSTLKQVMDRLYSYLESKVLTEIPVVMWLQFGSISTYADFTFTFFSESFASEEIKVSKNEFDTQVVPGFGANLLFWTPQMAEKKQIKPYTWRSVA